MTPIIKAGTTVGSHNKNRNHMEKRKEYGIMAKIKTEETFRTIVEKLIVNLNDENRKKAAKSQKQINKYAAEFPEWAENMGLEAEALDLIRVRKFGTIGNIVAVDTTHSPFAEMRIAKNYYNTLVKNIRPLVDEYHALHTGPHSEKYEALYKKIDELYRSIGTEKGACHFDCQHNKDAEYRENRKNQFEQFVTETREQISAAKKEAEQLLSLVRAERKELAAKNADKIKTVRTTRYNDAVKAARLTVRMTMAGDSGLCASNYMREEASVKAAFEKALGIPKTGLHYNYEDRQGNPPDSILTFNAWDGEGTISTICPSSMPDDKKSVEAIHAGECSVFQIRDFDPATDIAKFGLHSTFKQRYAKGRPVWHVARLFAGTQIDEKTGKRTKKSWYESMICLHRELSPDPKSRVAAASLIRRKVGFRHKTELFVQVAVPTTLPSVTGKIVLTPLSTRNDAGEIEFCEWVDATGVSHREVYPNGNKAIDAVSDTFKLRMNSIKQCFNLAVTAIDDLFGGSANVPLGTDYATRGQMRYAMKAWKETYCKTAEDNAALTELYRLALQGSAPNDAGVRYGGNYESFVRTLASEVKSYFPSLTANQAGCVAALITFNERYSHIYKMAVDSKERALRHRKNMYFNFANKLTQLGSVIEINIPVAQRRLSEEAKLTGASILTSCLKSTAQQRGVLVQEIKPKKAK